MVCVLVFLCGLGLLYKLESERNTPPSLPVVHKALLRPMPIIGGARLERGSLGLVKTFR